MSIVLPHRAIQAVSASRDPKQAILDFIGDLDDVEIIGDQVLIATYIRPEKTAGGIIRPDTNKEEDVWQGKVGLVVKWGPDAFVDQNGVQYSQVVNVGEWGVFFIGDAKPVHIKGYPCRVIRDSRIIMKVKNPEVVL